MVNNSDRTPPDSLQILTECLCDDQKMPFLHDPNLREHNLSFKAIPHYNSFVRERDVDVKQGAKERDESVLLHQDSLLEESEAYHSVQKEADGVDQQHLKYINKK